MGKSEQLGRLGAVPVEDGLVEFRVWAPNATRVETGAGALESEGGGVFAARLPAIRETAIEMKMIPPTTIRDKLLGMSF